jgi:dTDP-4-dehydrorhamnose 3,5-epimerase
MHLVPTTISGAYVIEPELLKDKRGFFARTFCQDQFASEGLVDTFKQWSLSFNVQSGTIRGLHLQLAPFAEVKLIRCTMGRIFDVIVDVRPDSPTFKSWFSTELSAENRHTLYVPAGLAHGFQTLEDSCEVQYHMSTNYEPRASSGIKYDDQSLAIEWPLPVSIVSDKDMELLPLAEFLELQAARI